MRLRFSQTILGFLILLVFIITNSTADEFLYGPVQEEANIISSEVSIVVYREHSDDTKNIPVIFMNDCIVASLLPGEYIQTRVCDSKIKFRVATRGEVPTRGKSENIDILKKSITYIKMIKSENETFVPQVVDKIQGEKELKNINRLSNVINRYIPKIVLDADTLFAFNSSELLSSAHAILDKLINDIKICPNEIKRIKIVGHADRIGSEKNNEKISKSRAQEVANYFTKNGINIPMNIEGHGSREPITTQCEGEISPSLIECLQPDRRVVIEH